ncbi:mas-related G-protein coupled receptor member X1-like [Petaurus breviceps papuanus]|uniref:mas-related G-protein coupled receptor member X1-like n=1 Tax=Petaurus breviceps papuanus TaxID=3040969 RepID=UPI0036DB5D83
MAVTPTPGQREYVCEKRTEGRASGGLGSYGPGNFYLEDWMRILTMLIALVGLVGNSEVLWLLGFRIQRNPFSVYILNLAAADALFLCCAFLRSLDHFASFFYFSYMALCFVTYTSSSVGLSLLTAISTERCLSVLFPIWYRCHRPKHTSAAVCAGLWTIGVLIWLLVVFFVYVREHGHDSCYLGYVIPVVWFSLLTCVLFVSSLTLLLRVQCSSQRRQPPRLYLLVLLNVLVFQLCGLAPGMEIATGLFGTYFMPFWMPWLLGCVNSSANPFIYFFLGRQRNKRREPLRVLLQRVLADDQEMGRKSGDIPHTSTLETSS